jgi:putative hydrolase of the HAD superfamily
MSDVAAVFFDVDFTLIYPGPTFQAEGYARFCARHGLAVDPSRFAKAVRAASVVLEVAGGLQASEDGTQHVHDDETYVRFTKRVIEGMGGRGAAVDACAREVYAEWAACHHFFLYDDVTPVLRELAGRGLKLGLISNSHRCLTSFQRHFELEGLITAAVTSYEHGYVKPHPSIFRAALTRAGVEARQSVMVGDSLAHDVEGARRVGMRGVLLHRARTPLRPVPDVPVIHDMSELPPLL